VSPVQDMTFCSSSGMLFLIRYPSNLSSPDSTASSSSSGLFYRIQSFHISNGILLNERDVSVFLTAPQQVHYSLHPVGKIVGSTLTIVSGGQDRHLLLSLRCSSPNNDSTAICHYTFNKDNLNLVDFLKPSTSRFVSNDDDDDDMNSSEENDEYFVQHVDHRILYCRRSRRGVDIDPIVQIQNHHQHQHQHIKTTCDNVRSAFDQPSSCFSRTLAVAKTTKNIDFIGVVRVAENGTLHVQQEKEEQIILASSSSSFSSSNSNSISKRRRQRWKVRYAKGDNAFFEDPDEESIGLDEVNLTTGKKLRSISTAITRTKNRSYFSLSSILVPQNYNSIIKSDTNVVNNNYDDVFLVLSGLDTRSNITFKIIPPYST
jgi:hypothetical protein